MQGDINKQTYKLLTMKLTNYFKQISLVAMVASVFTACDKVDTPDPLGGQGQTLVKLINGGNPGKSDVAIDFVPEPTTLTVADIRRDIPNESELNKTMNVTVLDDTAALRAYDTSLIYLPAAWYTINSATPKTGGVGGVFNLVLAPGEFAKQIEITIPDATILDVSSKYGLAFTITSADAGGKISSARTIVVIIGAKNDWDGVYEISGTFVDVASPAFTSDYPFSYALVTAGASTCDVINLDLNGGIPGYFFLNNGTGTYYGGYGLVISFDPVTNVVSELHNYYGDPTKPATGGGDPSTGSGPPLYAAPNTRRAVLDPSGVNAVQPNKDIIIKHWLVQPNTVATGPRAIFDETWKYIGPR